MACQRANRPVAQARIWYCFVILMRMQENNQQRGFLCRISMLVGGLEHFFFHAVIFFKMVKTSNQYGYPRLAMMS